MRQELCPCNPSSFASPQLPHSPAAAGPPRRKSSRRRCRPVPARCAAGATDKPDFFASTGRDFSVARLFPHVVRRDDGQRILPENLGDIGYDIRTLDLTSSHNYTADAVMTNARSAKAVRAGFVSFFFHTFWLEPEPGGPGFVNFKKTVEGFSQLGDSWIAPSKLP